MPNPIPTQKHCPQCGAPLSPRAPEGLCPRCVAALNLQGDSMFAGSGEGAAQLVPAIADLAPHFPQLEVLEYLGRGGMGVVYKSRQKTLNRLVALKLLAPERVADAKFAARFAQEAKALAALSHPNIVTIYDFGQAGGFYYLLMEFVDGVNLRQAMQAGRFTPEQALSIVPPVCEGLQYAHEHGVVHRDIKPENLLLDREGRVKIADFGIAKMLGADGPGASAAESQPAGTPQYMAPEQRAEPERAGHRADIYSLGVVLYEMLTGELPAAQLQPPSRRIRVDVRIDEIVLRALETKPELRFATAADFQAEVEGVATAPRAPGEPRVSARVPIDARITVPAFGVLIFFIGLTVGALLLETFRSRSGSGHLLMAVLALLLAVPVVAFVSRRLKALPPGEPEHARTWLKVSAGLAFLFSVPAVGLGMLFATALLNSRGGWHPTPAEAVMVPLIILGAILLPVAGVVLWREAKRHQSPRPQPPGGLAWAMRVLLIAAGAALVMFAFLIVSYLLTRKSAAEARAARMEAEMAYRAAAGDRRKEPAADAPAPRGASDTPPVERQDATVARSFPLRHRLASTMMEELRPMLPAGAVEVSASADNQVLTLKGPRGLVHRAATFIAVVDWPDSIKNAATGEYLNDTVLRAARSFFHACAVEESAATISKLVSPFVLAALKGDPRSREYEDYLMGAKADPAWEAALRADWPGKEEAIRRFIAEWNRHPLKRITEDAGVAMGFGVKHFCSVSFDGAPKEFYQVTIEPDRRRPRGDGDTVYLFSSLPPWRNEKPSTGAKETATPSSPGSPAKSVE